MSNHSSTRVPVAQGGRILTAGIGTTMLLGLMAWMGWAANSSASQPADVVAVVNPDTTATVASGARSISTPSETPSPTSSPAPAAMPVPVTAPALPVPIAIIAPPVAPQPTAVPSPAPVADATTSQSS